MKILVGVSNRHCHLTQEIYEQLFGTKELTTRNPLNQPGQFAANEVVTIKGPKGEIPNVRILGPFRSYNQVEVSKTDCYKLGINPPVRKSGDLENAAPITIIGPLGSITLPCAIIANRHIHISAKEAAELGIKDDEPVTVYINTSKKGTVEAYFKVTEESFKEIHFDTDDANAFLLSQNAEVEIDY